MNSEGIMLSERYKRTNILRFHLYEILRRVKFIKIVSKTVVKRGWGKEKRGVSV